MDLNEIRKEINEIDSILITNIAKRMELSKKIAQLKFEKGSEIQDKKREEEIIQDRAKRLESLGIKDSEFSKKLFNTIIEESKLIQENKINELKNGK